MHNLDDLYSEEWFRKRHDPDVYNNAWQITRSIWKEWPGENRCTSLLDLGAGNCSFANYFSRWGVEDVAAVDGGSSAEGCCERSVEFFHHDLRLPLDLGRQFDVVMSLEVAEHIEKEYEGVFLDTIFTHARDRVVFTAAPPGAESAVHFNLEEQEYWISRFAAAGFRLLEDVVKEWRMIWMRTGVRGWYYRNLMVFKSIRSR